MSCLSHSDSISHISLTEPTPSHNAAAMTANRFFTPSLNLLQVSGEKAGQLLHGQFTNNIRDLVPGTGNYNLFLTVKGKVLADLHVLCREDDFLLLIPQNFFSLIRDHLQKLAPLSRVTLLDVSGNWRVIHVLGNSEPAAQPNTFLFRSDRLGETGYDVITPANTNLSDALTKTSGKELTANEAENLRIQNGVPKVGIDVTEANLPQEAGLSHALNFTKGCYLGQEIVARLEYRGRLTKKLERLIIDGSAKADAILTENSDAVGRLTSVAFNEQTQKTHALGFVKTVDANTPRDFTVDGAKAIIHVQS